MEYIKKYKWALGGFVVMVLLNIGLLVTIWMILPPPQLPGTGIDSDARPRVQRFLQRELNLDQQQRQQMRDLRQQHLKEMQPLMQQIREHRMQALQLVSSTGQPLYHQKMDSLAAQIGRLHSEIERHNYRHFQQIRTQLNEAQQKRFDTVIKQTLTRPHRMRRGSSRGRGPGGMFNE